MIPANHEHFPHGLAWELRDPMRPELGKQHVFCLDLLRPVVMEAGFGQRKVKESRR